MEIWIDFGFKTWMYKRKDFSEKLNDSIMVKFLTVQMTF